MLLCGLINREEHGIIFKLIENNFWLFVVKFNAHKNQNVYWDGDDFHNRYEALNYLINRYDEMDELSPTQQKEHMTSIASFNRIVLNYLKMLKIK